MGGGGVMRAAAKVAGFGVNGSFRGALQEHSVTTTIAARKKFSKPTESISSSPETQDNNSAVFHLSENGNIKSASSIQKPSWEIDDWEFTDDAEEVLLSNSVQSVPRVIFGGVPTLEEAKEATSELKDALEMVYSSSTEDTDCKNSTIVAQQYGLEFPENMACVSSETALALSSESKPLFQAFSLLKGSPVAQSVVASLASDRNVWDAVMGNEKVMEFLKLQQTIDECNEDQISSKSFDDDEYDVKHFDGSENMFMKSIQSLKFTVVEMMNNVSLFFQDLLRGPEAGNIVSSDENENASAATKMDKVFGASFMALAVMAIMVVVLKRA